MRDQLAKTLTFWNRLAEVGLSGLGQFVLLGVVSRQLGGDGLGSWQALFQIFSLIQLFELGTNQGVIKVLSRHFGTESWSTAWRSASTALWAAGLLVCVGGLVASLVAPRLMPLPNEWDFRIGLGLLSLWCVFRFRLALGIRAGYAANHIVFSSSIELLVSALRPWLAAAILLCGGGFLLIPVSFIAAEALSYAVGWACMPRQLQRHSGAASDPRVTRDIWSFGFSNGLISMSSQASGYLQPLLIGYALGLHDLTTYTCGMALVALIARVGYIPASIIYPQLLREMVIGRFRARDQLSHRHVLVALILLALACLGFQMLYATVVTWWVGPDFAGSSLFASLLALCIATYVVQDYLLTLTRVCHDTMWGIGLVSAVQTALVVGLTIPCVQHFGVVGASAVLLLSHGLGIGWYLVALLRFDSRTAR